MKDLNEIRAAAQMLVKHADCIAWTEFGDNGNSCGPYTLDSEDEIKEDAFALAAVKIVVPKGSTLHYDLTRSVAQVIGCGYVTYDWIIKVLGRIVVVSGSYNDLHDMLKVTIARKANNVG
ncbi:hypothetical protein KM868_09690 [Micrococcus luteus]|nr:hypothetical protein [Micrococcus luteus]